MNINAKITVCSLIFMMHFDEICRNNNNVNKSNNDDDDNDNRNKNTDMQMMRQTTVKKNGI